MDRELYPLMAQVEDSHWWFCSRRAIVASMLSRLGLSPGARILEPGCGTGGNFAMLARFGEVYAMDADVEACKFSTARKTAIVEPGQLPDRVPFERIGFDLVVMTDVLEHLDRDQEALSVLRERLKPGGWLLATVPAFSWLWSEHDVTHHHQRRYVAGDLRALFERAGYTVAYLSYYNFLLFPGIAAARLLGRLRKSSAQHEHDLRGHSGLVNSLLRTVFSSERYAIGHLAVPFGVSLLVLARRS
ncbi:MAG: class I SAM-dependent methyltransferase [Candidatus Binatus sp.]